MFSPTALICLVLFIAADTLVLFTRTSWIGFLGYTPEWTNAGLYVLSPLFAGVAAFLSRTYLSSEVVAISSGRSLWGSTATVAAAWLRVVTLALLGHGVVMTVALSVSMLFGPSGAITWEPFVYAIMPTAMACALGVAFAAILPQLWSSVLALISAYALWYVAVVYGAAIPVNIGGATVSLAGLQYRLDILIALSIAAALVTTMFLTVAVVAVRTQSFGKGLAGFVAAALCFVLVGTIAGARIEATRFETSPDPTFTCAGSAPDVCTTVEHSTRLAETAIAIDRAAEMLRSADVSMAGLVLREETTNSGPGKEGVLLLQFGQLNGIGMTEADYANALLRPANCDEYYAPEPTVELDRLLIASQLVGDWMNAKLNSLRPVLNDDQVDDFYQALRVCSVGVELLDSVDLP